MAYSESAKKATAKYQKKNYDRISLIVYKGDREIIAKYCETHGKTVNGLINELLENTIPELQEKRLFGEKEDKS